jgi:hypothetical protein
MMLHANAALSWHGRRLLVRRVVEQGWTLTATAEAAGVSVRCAAELSRRDLAASLGSGGRGPAGRVLAHPRRWLGRLAPQAAADEPRHDYVGHALR